MDLGNIDMGEIEKIISSLSAEDMEMLGNMAGQFFSSSSEKEKSERTENEKSRSNNEKIGGFPDFSDIPIDFETIRKIAAVMQKLNSNQKDERCDFLLSLKPMLSEPRQKKIDTAITMLRLFSILPIINEFG